MGVRVREKPKDSGVYWIFINHQGIRRSKRIGTDKKEAEIVAEKVKAKLVLGELKVEKINKNGPKFKELAEKWLKLPHDWKESTRERYSCDLINHINSVFGDLYLDKITRKQIKSFFDDLYIKGLTVNTLRNIRAPFRGVLSYAMESEIIDVNPFDGLKMDYKSTQKEIQPLSEIEAANLLERIKTFLDGKYYPPILLMIRTGLRIGEVQALEWSDIDFEKRTIEVKRSWRNGSTTKTKNKKNRRVSMSPQLAEALKELRTEQKRKALRECTPVSKLVFTGSKKDRLDRLSLKYAMDHCLKELGLNPIRVHDLRHTYATIRLMRGHNVLDVSHQLGHSKTSITLDVYAHWIPGNFQSEIDDLDNLHPNAPHAHPGAIVGDKS